MQDLSFSGDCCMCYTCVCRHLFVPWGLVLSDGSDLGAAIRDKATLIRPTDWSDKSFIKPSISRTCRWVERPVQPAATVETPVRGWKSGCQHFYRRRRRTKGHLQNWFLHGLHQVYICHSKTQTEKSDCCYISGLYSMWCKTVQLLD